jgi:hypothetical protein
MLDKKKLEIAKETAEIKLNDPTGVLTIEASLRQAQRNFNKLKGLNQIIKNVRGDEDD